MAWFGRSRAEKPNAASREDRSKCWETRDAYFSCLDAAEVVVPGTEGSKCASQRNAYEQNCAKSWIDYFNQRRVLAEKQKPLLAQAAVQAAEARRS
ncbi:cytochrome oxidase c subunit VIb-domain-containing protein [Russula ochroleuca]|uniref:Cytochrome oxidase c subunit VIb-domain-containing protein n=1 Tax=Russula ochroleuca TaxID=152965 RepID=A0A9P5MPZ2_9AGAM|nr:cytochrome oxidase c subunit VIb-domain-containing protein [Russula ochroleuca]